MNAELFSLINKLVEKDSCQARQAIYNNLKRRKLSFKLFSLLTNQLKKLKVYNLLLFIWGVKTVIKIPLIRSHQFITLTETPGEKGVAKKIKDLCHEDFWSDYKNHLLAFCPHSKQGIKTLLKTFRLMNTLRSRYSPLLAFRVTEFIFLHLKLQSLNAQKESILLLSSLTPKSAALYALAQKKNLRTIFIGNGLDSPPLFPLKVDVYIGENPYNTKHLIPTEQTIIQKSFDFHPKSSRDVKLQPLSTVGVFLSAAVSIKGLKALIEKIHEDLEIKRILIREHPTSFFRLTRTEKKMIANHNVHFSSNSLEEDINECDIIFSGNSSVHLDALLSETPTIYVSTLDEDPFDLLELVKNGVVPECSSLDNWKTKFQSHYQSHAWKKGLEFYCSKGQLSCEDLR